MSEHSIPHIPVLRAGEEYESLDKVELKAFRDGRVMAHVSQANAGIVKRDLRKLRKMPSPFAGLSAKRLHEICREAGQRFVEETLPLNQAGATQSPDDYVASLSMTSGLPHVMCRRNMQKVFTVFDQMPDILGGLMRGMDAGVIDTGFGEHCEIPVCYGRTTDALGVVLPSNSPGVNSIWMPALALKTPVVLKPGREEPWTPMRIIQAFLEAGMPRAAFYFYPTSHEGSAAILEHTDRSLLFGDAKVTDAYAHDPRVQIHGPGRSKVLIGADAVGDWREYLDILEGSVADNGGRSCINASTILVPAHGDEIAAALAERLGPVDPVDAAADDARLSAFANPKIAEFIDAAIEQGVRGGGAEDVTARFRSGPRHRIVGDAHYLTPTVVRCQSLDHPLARTEFLFPFVAVVEVSPEQMIEGMGPSLVVTAISRDTAFVDALLRSPHVDRVNVGPVKTSHVEWDQPHEGNLFEFLYERRAIQKAVGW